MCIRDSPGLALGGVERPPLGAHIYLQIIEDHAAVPANQLPALIVAYNMFGAAFGAFGHFLDLYLFYHVTPPDGEFLYLVSVKTSTDI
jgi:hypothetical protein